jgi:hypothetical protein
VALRALVVFFESFIPNFAASSFWIDYISISRTCPADSTSRAFGLMPARFTYRLGYLAYHPWWQRLGHWFSERLAGGLSWLRERRPGRQR